MRQSPVKIARRAGLFGLAFNFLITLFSFPGVGGWSLPIGSLYVLTSLCMVVVGVVATRNMIDQTTESGGSVTFGYGAKIGWISGSIAALPITLLLVGIGLILMYLGNLAIRGGDEWLWLIGIVIIIQSIIYPLTILFCVLSAGIAAVMLKNRKLDVGASNEINTS